MRNIWKDGITTLGAVATAVMGWAYFHNWTWPLMSSERWVIAGMALMGLIVFTFGYMLDSQHVTSWAAAALVLLIVVLGITTFGLVFATSGYVTALMWSVLAFWVASVGWHTAEHTSTPHHSHA